MNLIFNPMYLTIWLSRIRGPFVLFLQQRVPLIGFGSPICVWHGNCARWDVGCGMWFQCFAMGILVMFMEFLTSQIMGILLGTPPKKCTETHLVDLWGYGYWIIWYVYIYTVYIYTVYIYIFMFAWKQQIVDTFRGTCQVSIISTENPPKKSTGCRTHQGTSCTSQNRHLGHHLADATVWIWTREFKPTCLRYLDATIANHGGILATVYKHILVTLVLHLIFNFIWYCSSLIVFGYSRKIIYIPCWDQPPFILQVT